MARELAPAGVRSAPKISGAAAQPSGSKLPRHRCSYQACCRPAAVRGMPTNPGNASMLASQART
ncbi:hypothetical protein DBR46_25920 [Pseudomonas sp. KBW05]|nr:hypothetical protein DBR46_25920 [Pseudomonas sp. KBW05]